MGKDFTAIECTNQDFVRFIKVVKVDNFAKVERIKVVIKKLDTFAVINTDFKQEEEDAVIMDQHCNILDYLVFKHYSFFYHHQQIQFFYLNFKNVYHI